MDQHASVSCWVWIKLLLTSAQRLRRGKDPCKRASCELQPSPSVYYIYFTKQISKTVHLQGLTIIKKRFRHVPDDGSGVQYDKIQINHFYVSTALD